MRALAAGDLFVAVMAGKGAGERAARHRRTGIDGGRTKDGAGALDWQSPPDIDRERCWLARPLGSRPENRLLSLAGRR